MKIGAHQSIAGGYFRAIERIVGIGGNCLQIFSSSPRSWQSANPKQQEIDRFLSEKEKYRIDPVYFHATYLINLADDGKIGLMSKKTLINEMALAGKLNIKGSIVHLGSFKKNDRRKYYSVLIKNISEVLEATPSRTFLIAENSGNHKIGENLKEISNIIKDVASDRLRVCLDSCHLHAAGYNLGKKDKFEALLSDFDKKIGLEKLEVWHINDSRDGFASFRDRHDNIGKGFIDIEAFRLILNHRKTRNHPFIIETPGFDNQGPDKKNLDILKALRSSS
ncbi:deoxyribonuclease IV [Candidatus Roizmanbacteria bacterium]|nr:deoxyribonuclease IV [Candidatus Roizmanbacteria bacterium]